MFRKWKESSGNLPIFFWTVLGSPRNVAGCSWNFLAIFGNFQKKMFWKLSRMFRKLPKKWLAEQSVFNSLTNESLSQLFSQLCIPGCSRNFTASFGNIQRNAANFQRCSGNFPRCSGDFPRSDGSFQTSAENFPGSIGIFLRSTGYFPELPWQFSEYLNKFLERPRKLFNAFQAQYW